MNSSPPSRKILPQIHAAAEIWQSVKDTPQPADRWLANYFHRFRKRFGSRDRRFISETVFSLFRHRTFLEVWANALNGSDGQELIVLLAAAAEEMAAPEEFDVCFRELCRKAAPPDLYASLRRGKLPGSFKADSEEDALAIRYSFPLWLVKKWRARFGAHECEALLEASQKRPPLALRVNPLKVNREKLMRIFQKKQWECRPSLRSPLGIIFEDRANVFDSEEFRDGFFEIQDEGSQIVCQCVEPKPGEWIWDVCAGGGGKSLALAALMQNKGRVVATDIRAQKLDELKKRAKRAGAFNIFPADLKRIGELRQAKEGFDKILIDAPCSGTGTIRRNPDSKWKLKQESFQAFHRDQAVIIENALPYLKKGGRLYYATCSMEPEENDEVIREILQRHPALRLVSPPGAPDGFLRLFPHQHQSDGFFLAIAENTIK